MSTKDLGDFIRDGGDLVALLGHAGTVAMSPGGASVDACSGQVTPASSGTAGRSDATAAAPEEDTYWWTYAGDRHRSGIVGASVEDPGRGLLHAVIVLEIEAEGGGFVPKYKARMDLNSDRGRKTFVNAGVAAAARPDLAEKIAWNLNSLSIDLPRRVAERAAREAAAGASKKARGLLADTPAEAIEAARRMLASSAEDLERQVLEDARTLGLVGEGANFLAVLLATVSRLDAKPINILFRGPASTGKSRTTNTALSLVPSEEKVEAGGLSDKALLYLEPNALAHRVVYVTERPKLAKGQKDIGSHVFRDLAERGEASRITTTCPPAGGDPVAKEFHARGPIAYIETTTNARVCDEDGSRMVEITPDDSAAQTGRVVEATLQEAAAPDPVERGRRRKHSAGSGWRRL